MDGIFIPSFTPNKVTPPPQASSRARHTAWQKKKNRSTTRTMDEIIQRRKDLWADTGSMKDDADYRQAAAEYILDNLNLIEDCQRSPELLIESLFIIVDKKKELVPFFLNAAQQGFLARMNAAVADFRDGRRHTIRLLLLKGRQQGMTSFITAYQLASTILKKNFEGFTAADTQDNTSAIFLNKAKHPYDLLPNVIKPSEKYNNRRELYFDKLNSSWEVKTASSKMGRSRTINFFHGSEVAFWTDPISEIQRGLGEALTQNAIQIYESTANGYNEFKDLWDSGSWDNVFLEWWLTPEYRAAFPDDGHADAFADAVDTNPGWIWERLRWLNDKGLDLEQLHWYQLKYNGYLDKESIKQEYPCTPEEAFLSSGRCVFDSEALARRISYLRDTYGQQPYKRYTPVLTWHDPETKDKVTGVEFLPDPLSTLRVYEEPDPLHYYVIGADTAGDGSDRYGISVIDNCTGRRVAAYEGKPDPQTFAHLLYGLGTWYKNALIAVEVNFDLFPTIELERLRYSMQYHREVFDTYQNRHTRKNGFRTDGNTRPLIISTQQVTLKENIDLFFDIDMLQQCLTFVYDADGRPCHEVGKHDDILFADMIANLARDQQDRLPDVPEKPKTLIQTHKEQAAKRTSKKKSSWQRYL